MDLAATMKRVRGAIIATGVMLAAHSAHANQPANAAFESAIGAARLPEPLVPTRPTSILEDAALSQALALYGKRARPDDFSSLNDFLSTHPHSGWSAALLTDIGILNLHYGYFSGALLASRQAWDEGKMATEPRARVLVDGALGRLAWLEASLGHFDELQALFDEIGSRPVSGSSTETLQAAREALALAQTHPKHLLLCGPVALGSLMLKAGARHDQVRFVHTYVAGPNGTSLADVARLADQSNFARRLVFRQPGQSVPVPSIVHWKVGHFAAIVGQSNGRFEVEDPVFPGQRTWVTPKALDTEATGYFLVPTNDKPDGRWRDVKEAEASTVWGKGPTNGTRPGDAGDPPANPTPPPGGGCPLCGYNIAESSVAVTLSDTPVGYAPPIGPSAKVTISYNQREASQPQNFSFFNVSPKWTLNWLTYVTDDPTNPGANVSRYLASGGAFYYSGFDSGTGRFAAQDTDGSVLVLVSQSPVTYERRLSDGSVETYAQSDGGTAYPRRVFLSKIADPQGNALTLNYDSQQRLLSLTDAVGRQTTFTYSQSRPLLVARVTDPFGRSASLSYDASGRLASITDIIGLRSSFTYDANSLVNSLTTPYGTTTFAYTAPGTSAPPRFVQATDPLGNNEREEWLEPAPVSSSDPTSTVPQGTPIPLINNYLQYRNSFHWDKNAYVAAGCTPSGGCDYSKARETHFEHMPPNTSIKSTTIESVKYPLENRIWRLYPGQTSSIYGGTFASPTAQAKVLDDGTNQIWQSSYDSSGYFKLTQTIDPLGRTTSYAYPNHIDLAAITQTVENGDQTTLAQYIYNGYHRPLFYTDAAGQTTSMLYNAQGQITSLTDPLGHTTTFAYDVNHNLSSITNANNATAASFTYDARNRVATYTDSEGWSVSLSYDDADRITRMVYPDGTSDNYSYVRLDLASYTDRLNRTWTYSYDANRHLTATTDPSGATTSFGYNQDGKLTSLTDAKGNTTSWTYDIEGRATSKIYADASTVAYTYENATSRLKSVTDALGQIKQFAYAADDRVTGLTYQNAVNPTPNVSVSYDTYFPRTTSMADGTGSTTYAYGAVGALGALRLLQENGPLLNSAIAYSYDALGRLASRSVAQSTPQTFQYDALGRLTSEVNDLGTFAFSYLGQTSLITSRALSGSSVATSWGYLSNTNDRRLASINNTGFSTATFSNYQLTTDAEAFIRGITETSDAAAAYPSVSGQTASYNALNQLTNLSGQTLTYDANGNLLSDGQRSYSWDAENRLVGIVYPGQPGQTTSFAYDGLDRRTLITSTPAGGSAASISYLWCGSRLCQSRDITGAAKRAYYTEGEYGFSAVPQSLLYGVDQIGSVRRIFSSTTNAPAYPYDPYGNSLSSAGRLTDFGFARLFFEAGSGLYLSKYRAYDPATGRWTSRDPVGEFADKRINLYEYVRGNVLRYADPLGLQPWPYPPPGIPGGPYSPATGQRAGTYFGPKQPAGGRAMCRYVPDDLNGGPLGTKEPYWKYNPAGGGPMQKYDAGGAPLPPGNLGHPQDDLKPPVTPEPAQPPTAPEPVAPPANPEVPLEIPEIPPMIVPE